MNAVKELAEKNISFPKWRHISMKRNLFPQDHGFLVVTKSMKKRRKYAT